MTILVVEDDKNISDIIKYNLKKENYNVLVAYDGEEGLKLFNENKVDLMLLDIMMPKMNGLELCKIIRKNSKVPIIMLTAKAEEDDKIAGFDLGADDYVTKPFSNKELLARIKANLRRTDTVKSNTLTFGEIVIDTDKFEITKNGEILNLSKRELELTIFLATQKEKVFSREELLEKVWGYEYVGDSGEARVIDVTIRRLRKKLENSPEEPKYILTKRGLGYYFGGI